MDDSQQSVYTWILTATASSYQLLWLTLVIWPIAAIWRRILNPKKR